MRGLKSCIGLIQITGRGLLLLLGLLLLPSVASAVDYYWTRSATQSVHYPTALAACQATAAGYSTGRNAQITGWQTANRWGCKFEVYASGSGQWNWTSAYVLRSGDSCPSGTNFNSATAECVPDQCASTVDVVIHHEFRFQSIGADGNPSTDPPVTVCKNSCQYSHTFGDFTSKRDFGPPDQQVGSFEYRGNGVSCTPSASNPSVFDQPPTKDPVTTPPEYFSDNSCSSWETQTDGTITRSCTSSNSYADQGEVDCKYGTPELGQASSLTCTPSKANPPEKTATEVSQDASKTPNPDGSTETTTTTDTTKTSCKGLEPCTSTTKSETSTETTDGDGNTTSQSGNCTGSGCNPENPNEEPTEEEEVAESSVSGDASCDATPACDGDAIQCAILRQTHKTRCNQEEFQDLGPDKVADAQATLDSEFSGDDYSPLTAGSEGTFNLAGMLDTSSSIAGSCPALPDISITLNGQTRNFSFSTWMAEFCKYVVWFSYLMVAFAMRSAAEIVAGGFK